MNAGHLVRRVELPVHGGAVPFLVILVFGAIGLAFFILHERSATVPSSEYCYTQQLAGTPVPTPAAGHSLSSRVIFGTNACALAEDHDRSSTLTLNDHIYWIAFFRRPARRYHIDVMERQGKHWNSVSDWEVHPATIRTTDTQTSVFQGREYTDLWDFNGPGLYLIRYTDHRGLLASGELRLTAAHCPRRWWLC